MEIGENLWRIRGINVDKKYFAYGICVNAESFKRVMRIAGCEDKFHNHYYYKLITLPLFMLKYIEEYGRLVIQEIMC